MSDRIPAPASVADLDETSSRDVAEVSSARSQAQPDDSGSDARSDEDDSEFRTATRLLRLLKLALGTLVSFLTALKLLGVL